MKLQYINSSLVERSYQRVYETPYTSSSSFIVVCCVWEGTTQCSGAGPLLVCPVPCSRTECPYPAGFTGCVIVNDLSTSCPQCPGFKSPLIVTSNDSERGRSTVSKTASLAALALFSVPYSSSIIVWGLKICIHRSPRCYRIDR